MKKFHGAETTLGFFLFANLQLSLM